MISFAKVKIENIRENNNNNERIRSPVPIAHAYNPSYSGDRDQEDQGSMPALANNS
jgi:hypothetical protein